MSAPVAVLTFLAMELMSLFALMAISAFDRWI
jgi:hypothetical protein